MDKTKWFQVWVDARKLADQLEHEVEQFPETYEAKVARNTIEQIIDLLRSMDNELKPQIKCAECKYFHTEECPMFVKTWVGREGCDYVVDDKAIPEGTCYKAE